MRTRGENPQELVDQSAGLREFIKSDGHAGCHITLTASTYCRRERRIRFAGQIDPKVECLSTGTAGKTG